MRKAMIPLWMVLVGWVAISELFFVAIYIRFRYVQRKAARVAPQQPPEQEQAVPVAEEEPQPVVDNLSLRPALLIWRRGTGCGRYAHTAEQHCPCIEQPCLMQPVSDKQLVRVYSALCLLDGYLSKEEHERFGSFLLALEAYSHRHWHTYEVLQLYRVKQKATPEAIKSQEN